MILGNVKLQATMENIGIIGGGGHARVIIDLLRSLDNIGEIYVFDDNPVCIPETKYIGSLFEINACQQTFSQLTFVCAIGDIGIRKKIIERFPWVIWGVFVHPSAVIGNNVKMNEGTIVFAGSVLQNNVKIGKHCIVNTRVGIDHDCKIGNNVHIAPGATLCGTISVGDNTFIGAGTTVIPNINIGSSTIIGAGSTVVRNIESNVTAYGVPCKVICSTVIPVNTNNTL